MSNPTRKSTWKVLWTKTSIIAIIFLGVFIFTKITGAEVKPWLFGIFSSLGLAAYRLALQKVSGNKGWRSYAAAVIVFGVSFLTAIGVVLPPGIIEIIYSIGGVLGIVGLRGAAADLQ